MHNYKEDIKILKQTAQILTKYNDDVNSNGEHTIIIAYITSAILKLKFLDKLNDKIKNLEKLIKRKVEQENA